MVAVLAGALVVRRGPVAGSLHLVFLDPGAAAVADRDRGRSKTGYGGNWDIGQLRDVLRADTPRLGLWLDSTGLSAEQTTDRILADLGASLVRLAG